jgi:hypothetical protein
MSFCAASLGSGSLKALAEEAACLSTVRARLDA